MPRTAAEKSTAVKPINPKTKVWKFYDDALDGTHLRCKICKDNKNRVHLVIVPQGSTSSMIFHLRQHSKEFKSFEEETELHEKETKKKNTAKKLATLELGIGSNSSSSSQKKYKYSLNGPMQSKFDDAVLKLLAVNCLPFSLVESPEWKALVELLDKRITVKNRKTYQRKMTKLADKVLTRVKRMIQKYCDVSCANHL